MRLIESADVKKDILNFIDSIIKDIKKKKAP